MRKRANVKDTETAAVVALVGETVDDELVVVGTVAGGLEVAGLLGVAEIANVPEVGDSVTVSSGTTSADLVVLVIDDEELLPGGVGDPTLVSVYAVSVKL